MKKKILVAALDWGLGHASRCIPLVRYFLSQDLDVYLASSSQAGILLQKEFPGLPYFSIPSYNIHYTKNKNLGSSIIRQIPGILNVTKLEHEWLNELNHQHHFQFVLSDNRYGLWNKDSYTIFLTHQLGIQSPFLPLLTAPLLRKLHYHFIKKFNNCWVPDFPGENNLSGILSHGFPLPKNTNFIGPVSRISPTSKQQCQSSDIQNILIILSGPEPQRTLFENQLKQQCSGLPINFKLVRGKMDEIPEWKTENNLKIISYLTTDQLSEEIHQTDLIVCRPGYTSIMDLAFCGKKAILIPTPGQTEQEYLAKYHKSKTHFYSEKQDDFNLERSLNKSLLYKGIQFYPGTSLLNAALKNIIGQL